MAHGGIRPGAGRPAKGNVVLYAYVSPEDKKFIKDIAKDLGITPGDVIHELINVFKDISTKE